MASKRINSSDIAEVAGVSRATVSYVLNERPGNRIPAQTRERVWSIARELGYQPNAAARALVTGTTDMIALWMPNAVRPIFSSVTRAVMNQIKDKKRVVITEVRNYSSDPVNSQRNLGEWHVDGIIGHDAASAIDVYLDTYRGSSPVVSIGPVISKRCDFVGVDLYGGSLAAVKHLIESGCQHPLFIMAYWTDMVSDPRARAFQEVCADAGIEPRFLSFTNIDRRDVRQLVAAYVAEHPDIDGLFCWNDEVAIASNQAMRDIGRKVPEDIILIGSDGIEENEYHYPSISTVAQPIEEMVRIAWEFLQKRIEDPTHEPQQMILPMELIKRGSTTR